MELVRIIIILAMIKKLLNENLIEFTSDLIHSKSEDISDFYDNLLYQIRETKSAICEARTHDL